VLRLRRRAAQEWPLHRRRRTPAREQRCHPRVRDGGVSITDGPYAETKEQIGGILILEASDLNHAIQLMSKHPGVRAGPFEIRPVADLTAMIRDSERRRTAAR
jgi:hypothetical protein